MNIRKEIDLKASLTDKQKKVLDKAAGMSVTFDDDSPKLSDEQLMEFRRISEVNRMERKKTDGNNQTVASGSQES